jgi:hypothetical protein
LADVISVSKVLLPPTPQYYAILWSADGDTIVIWNSDAATKTMLRRQDDN